LDGAKKSDQPQRNLHLQAKRSQDAGYPAPLGEAFCLPALSGVVFPQKKNYLSILLYIMKATLTVLFVYFSGLAFAQQSSDNQTVKTIPKHPNVTDTNGLRQGWWTIELDNDTRRPLSPEKIVFYRILEFKDDVPFGPTKDYYKNGVLYQEFTALSMKPYGPRGYSVKIDYTQPYKVYWEDGSENLIAPNRIQCDQYLSQGKYELALPFAQKALTATEKRLGKKNWRYAYFLTNMGTIHQNLGSYTVAEPYLMEAMKITDAINDKGLDYVKSPIDLAYLYFLMGNYSKAEQLYRESLSRAEKLEGKESPLYAASVNNMALLYDHAGDYKKGAASYREAASIQERLIGKDKLGSNAAYATNITNLAFALTEQGRLAEGERYYLQGLAIKENVFGKQSSHYALILSHLASLYLCKGDFAKAESLNKEALGIVQASGKNRVDQTAYQMRLVYTYIAKKDYEAAEPYALQAKDGYMRQVEEFFPSLSEFEKEAYYDKIRFFFRDFNAFCLLRKDQNPAILGELYNNQLATKALLLNSASKWKQRIRSSGDKKLFALYSDWESNHGVLARLSKQDGTDNQRKIDSLMQITNVQEKELSKRSESFATISEKKRSTWQDVKNKLKPNEVAIEMIRVNTLGTAYLITDSSDVRLPRYPIYTYTDTVYYAALLLTASTPTPELVLLKNGKELENKYAKLYSNSIKSQTNDNESYSQFWKPINDRLGKLFRKTKEPIRVYFSPDGVYSQININTLLNPITKKYVLDEAKISLVTNTKDLLVAQKEETYNNLAYLFGFPDYGVSVEDRNALVQKERDAQPVYYALTMTRGENSLSELPGTKKEVENIAEMMTASGWTPEILTGDKALEETLKDCFKPRVLHIATHGYFQPNSTTKQNPLLRSGLMLAGAGQTLAGNKDDRSEDGILTAYEAMNLNLDNTDLVVLSACETGLGEVSNGEGVYGLQRAFKVAGARSIIMSLWKVNDETTQELMTSFYDNWLKSGNKREAFEKAQQICKVKYKSPYHWGAFVMVGE